MSGRLTRRATLGAALWTAPVITVASAAPAMAVSGLTLSRTTPASPAFSEDLAVSRTVSVTLANGANPVQGATVTFNLTNTDWLRFPAAATSATDVTDSGGVASTVLELAPGAAPTEGEQVTLTATYQSLMVVWTITYRTMALVASGPQSAHVLAISSGLVYAWGDNGSGALGNGGGPDSAVPVVVDATGVLAGKSLVAAATGAGFSVVADSDGKAYSWGNGSNGRLGNGGTASSDVPVAVTSSGVLAGKKIIALASGLAHTVALTEGGEVFTWGAGGSGQLGNGATLDSSVPVAVTFLPPPPAPTIVAVAAGQSHSLALASNGVIYAWGDNGSGQLGSSLPLDFSVPQAISTTGTSLAGKTVTAIAAGSLHSLALAGDGTVHAWGFNGEGRLGNGNTTSSNTPVAVNTAGALSGKTVVQIASGGPFSLARDAAGSVYTWGRGLNGELGNGAFGNSNVPVAITTAGTPLAGKVVNRMAGSNVSAYASTTGLTAAWGAASQGRLGNGTTTPNIALAQVVSDLP